MPNKRADRGPAFSIASQNPAREEQLDSPVSETQSHLNASRYYAGLERPQRDVPARAVSAEPSPKGNCRSRFSAAHDRFVGDVVNRAYADTPTLTVRDAYRMYCHELLASELPDKQALSFTAFHCRVHRWIGSQLVKYGARSPSVPSNVNVRKLT